MLEAAGAATALDKGKHRVLVTEAGAALGLSLLATDKGLIDFDDLAAAADCGKVTSAQSFAKAVHHKPCALV
jgi:hypothetical protein